MADISQLQKLRPLGLLERYSTVRHHLGLYTNVCTSLTFSHAHASTAIPPLQAIVYRALTRVIARHASLSVIPDDESTATTCFVRLPQINLDDAVVFLPRDDAAADETSNAALDRVLETYHNLNFKERHGERPYWRLVILHPDGDSSSFTACFFFHHAIADGSSGVAFQRAFHAALVEVSSAEHAAATVDPIVVTPELPLLPSLEEMHRLPLGIWFLLKGVWAEFFAKPADDIWTAAVISDDPAKRHNCIRSFTLSAATTSGLIRASREHQTTLTGTLEAAVAAVLFAHLPPQFAQLKATGPISFRRFLDPKQVTNDDLGVYTSKYDMTHLRPPPAAGKAVDLFSWDDARQVRVAVEAELSLNGKNAAPALLRYAGNLPDLFAKRMGKTRGESFELSNVGPFKAAAADTTSWTAGRMVFSQSSNVAGPPLLVSAVSGGDGCLSISFVWLDGIVENEFADTVIRDLKDTLVELGA